MQPYLNVNHDSGVAGYDTGPSFIRVQFTDGAIYLYTDASAGSANIREMQRLATAGHGLNGYINTQVKYCYARRER